MTGVCLGWLIKMQTAEMIQTEENTVESSLYKYISCWGFYSLEQWRHTK